MKNILLICNAGLSTSMLVRRMEEHAKKIGVEVHIEAIGDGTDDNKVKNADVIFLGPQVRYLKNKLQETVSVSVEVIEMQDYGMMRGDKVLEKAIELMEEN